MLKKYFRDRVELCIEGLNIKRLIKTFYKNNIDLYDLKNISHKNIVATISKKDLKKSKQFLKDYKVTITKRYGFSFLKDFSLTRWGILVGFVCFVILCFFNFNFLSLICISGTNKISQTEIKSFLREKGIKEKTFFNNINLEDIESELEMKFEDISFVSIIKKGTNLLINIKEKLAVEDLSSSQIISPYSAQIISIELISGTLEKNIGDSVKKGEVIVGGYTENNGVKTPCKALANIKLKVWYSSSFQFIENETKVERTGNMYERAYYQIFGKKIDIKSKNKYKKGSKFVNKDEKIPFEFFEKETKTVYIFDKNILPIKITKEKFYEIKENLIKNDFSLQKDAIIEKTKIEALKKVPVGEEVLDIKTEVDSYDYGKIITTYVETVLEIWFLK